MAESAKWWIKRCYQFMVRKKARHTVRWPLASLPLASEPGEMISFDILRALPKTERGNEYIIQAVDLFSRHSGPYALTKGILIHSAKQKHWPMTCRGGDTRKRCYLVEVRDLWASWRRLSILMCQE